MSVDWGERGGPDNEVNIQAMVNAAATVTEGKKSRMLQDERLRIALSARYNNLSSFSHFTKIHGNQAVRTSHPWKGETMIIGVPGTFDEKTT